MTTIDEPELFLGKGPVKEDDRTLLAAKYFTPDLPPPPPKVDWAARVSTWPMFANNRYGCCTCATAGHMELAWTANAGSPPVMLSDADILAAYTAVTGFNPGDPATDRGAYELDVLNFWRQTGVGGRRIAAFVRLDHTDLQEVRQAIAIFGAVYTGFQLPKSAQAQFRAAKAWSQSRTVGDSRRGSWGGHAFAVFGYDPRYMTGVTWGRTQRLTPTFWRRYCDEAYALVSQSFLDAHGLTPQGLDLAALMDDLHRVTG